MLRIYARVLATALVVIAVAITVLVPGWGFVAGVFYVGSAVAFTYASFLRGDSQRVRSLMAAMGSLFVLSGLVVALAMGVLGFPFGGRVWEAGLAHGALGGLTMACAVLLPCDDDESASR